MKQPTRPRGDEPHIMFDVSEKVGNVRYFDDGPRKERKYFLGDMVESHPGDTIPQGIGVISEPTVEESKLPHDEENDLFVDWMLTGRQWTHWRYIGPRY